MVNTHSLLYQKPTTKCNIHISKLSVLNSPRENVYGALFSSRGAFGAIYDIEKSPENSIISSERALRSVLLRTKTSSRT